LACLRFLLAYQLHYPKPLRFYAIHSGCAREMNDNPAPKPVHAGKWKNPCAGGVATGGGLAAISVGRGFP
jgi:hypothetical protein